MRHNRLDDDWDFVPSGNRPKADDEVRADDDVHASNGQTRKGSDAET